MNPIKPISFVLCLLLGFIFSVSAKVALPTIFTDNLVLQQKAVNRIWGQAEPGKRVVLTTSWDGKNYETIVGTEGSWLIEFKTPAYGGPYSMDISDGESLRLNNILIGEVWLCSGQSNMEMPLAGWGEINNYKEEIARADYPQIRLLQAEHVTSNSVLEDVNINTNGWELCSPETVGDFSSVAYFFAREIYNKTKIPIGLIHTSWGGTVAEAWVSKESLKTMPDFNAINLEGTEGPNRPTVLYNAMIHPFIQYRIKGAIWYQGESNADRAGQYQTLFPLLIQDWRKQWDTGDFPFYFVQLASFMDKDEQPVQDSDWAELREAQLMTLALPNTGMAVAIDIGDAKDIHPKNKQDVGKRLALIALNRDYRQKNEYSGPMFRSAKQKGDETILQFDHADGLKAKGGELIGFTMAGKDNQFYPAKAHIKGTKVIVKSEQVSEPITLRYSWANNPDGNLYNDSGLPASPFRVAIP